VVTVTLVSVLAAGFLPCTTKPLTDIDVTLPLAPPNPANAPLLPPGRSTGPEPGRGEKVPRGPVLNPPPSNPAPALHLPLAGVLMVTVVAVTVLEAAPPERAAPLAEGRPTTVAQLPTVRSRDAAGTVSLIAVDFVKVTVTCPEVGFCTSRLEADTAAAVPTTPGKATWPLAGGGLLLATTGVAAVPELPQAVAASATSPRPTRAWA
jgi:hypothetical protein